FFCLSPSLLVSLPAPILLLSVSVVLPIPGFFLHLCAAPHPSLLVSVLLLLPLSVASFLLSLLLLSPYLCQAPCPHPLTAPFLIS
ncbi:unnamed protein product, partial [Bubo scandiacus]